VSLWVGCYTVLDSITTLEHHQQALQILAKNFTFVILIITFKKLPPSNFLNISLLLLNITFLLVLSYRFLTTFYYHENLPQILLIAKDVVFGFSVYWSSMKLN